MRVIADVAGQPPLWFEVEAAHAGLLSERADHVAIGLLLPAMRRGRDLHIGGEVTDVLLYQLNNDLQGLLRLVYPACSAIRVTTDATAAAGPMPQGVATGFSAGVDSFAVLTEFALSDDVPEPLRITHLLNNNVGAHGQEGRDLWRERCIGIRRITDELGLPLVTVDSNLDDFYPDMGFLETVTFRNATVPHLLGAGIGRFYSASGYSFEHIAVAGHQRAARVDPISLAPDVDTVTRPELCESRHVASGKDRGAGRPTAGAVPRRVRRQRARRGPKLLVMLEVHADDAHPRDSGPPRRVHPRALPAGAVSGAQRRVRRRSARFGFSAGCRGRRVRRADRLGLGARSAEQSIRSAHDAAIVEHRPQSASSLEGAPPALTRAAGLSQLAELDQVGEVFALGTNLGERPGRLRCCRP